MSSCVRPGVRDVARERRAAGQRVDERGLADVRAASEGDLGRPSGGNPSARAAAKMNSQGPANSFRPARSSQARLFLRSYARRLRRAGLLGEQLEEVVPELDLHARFAHDVILLEHRQRVVPGPVDDKAAGNVPSMKVKITGIHENIVF